MGACVYNNVRVYTYIIIFYKRDDCGDVCAGHSVGLAFSPGFRRWGFGVQRAC